jgi:hypothetical protein
MSKPPIGVRSITGSPPTITFPLLLAGSVGALLIYSAVVGKNPVDVVREAIGKQTPAGPPQRTVPLPKNAGNPNKGVGGGRYAV